MQFLEEEISLLNQVLNKQKELNLKVIYTLLDGEYKIDIIHGSITDSYYSNSLSIINTFKYTLALLDVYDRFMK